MPLDRDAHRKRRARQSRRSRSGGYRVVVKREHAWPVSKNRKVPSTIRDPRPRGLERRAGVVVHHARVHGVRQCPQSTGKASGPGMRSKALFAPRPALAKRATRDTRNETAASTEKPKSRYRRSRSANRAALRAERATPTSRRAASARNGVLTCRSASFGRRACRERRVRFASPSRRGVVARRKRIGRDYTLDRLAGSPPTSRSSRRRRYYTTIS